MFPGVNPRQMRQAMQKMGVSQEDMEADLVVIHMKDKEIVIRNPSVAKVKMMGQESFQISGVVEERAKGAPAIDENDVSLVVEQANCTKEEARAALEESGGDIAQAILSLAPEDE